MPFVQWLFMWKCPSLCMRHLDCENYNSTIASIESISGVKKAEFIPFLKEKYVQYNTGDFNDEFDIWLLSQFKSEFDLQCIKIERMSFFHMTRLPLEFIDGIIENGLKSTEDALPLLINFMKNLFTDVENEDWCEIEEGKSWAPCSKLKFSDESFPHGFCLMEYGIVHNKPKSSDCAGYSTVTVPK